MSLVNPKEVKERMDIGGRLSTKLEFHGVNCDLDSWSWPAGAQPGCGAPVLMAAQKRSKIFSGQIFAVCRRRRGDNGSRLPQGSLHSDRPPEQRR